jgi:hypothetical protein
MTAPVSAQRTAAREAASAAPKRPATTRVTILTGRRMTDLVLPAGVPVETYIDDTVGVLEDILDGTPAETLAGFDFKAQGVWSFARPGAPPLKRSQSLDEAGVIDGSLLTLVSTSRTERYRPLVEDVIDAIAVLDESPQFDRTALNRFIEIAIPVVAGATSAVSVASWVRSGQQWWWTVGLMVLGLAALAGGWQAWVRFRHYGFCESFGVAGTFLLAGGAATAVPLPRGYTSVGAPQLAAAAAVVVAVAVATRGGPRRRAEVAAFLATLAIAVTAAAVAYGYGRGQWVAAAAVALGLIVVTNAAKLTVAVARIALPPVPAPGESVSHEELLDPVVDPKVLSETSATWRAIIASVPESAARLSERSELAKRLLIGFVGAGVVILTAGAIAVVVQGHFFVHSLIVAGLVTLVCAFRARLYAERWCAWWLLAASVVVPIGVLIKVALWYPNWAWLTVAVFVVLGIAALVTVGATEGVRRVSPVARRVLELLDGLAIAAVIPMLLWIAGVYDSLRNIRF